MYYMWFIWCTKSKVLNIETNVLLIKIDANKFLKLDLFDSSISVWMHNRISWVHQKTLTISEIIKYIDIVG